MCDYLKERIAWGKKAANRSSVDTSLGRKLIKRKSLFFNSAIVSFCIGWAAFTGLFFMFCCFYPVFEKSSYINNKVNYVKWWKVIKYCTIFNFMILVIRGVVLFI